MKPFTILNGIAALLDRPNVDTDQIIPKQFLRKIERTGFGVHLFHDWRYLDDAGTKLNPDFSSIKNDIRELLSLSPEITLVVDLPENTLLGL